MGHPDDQGDIHKPKLHENDWYDENELPYVVLQSNFGYSIMKTPRFQSELKPQ